MKSYSLIFWKWINGKLGSAFALIEPVAKQIKMAIDKEDAIALRAHAAEGREAAQALMVLCDGILTATEDGELDLVEGAKIVTDLERFFDEAEDVVTGKDEDDPVPETAKKKSKKKSKKK